MYGQVTHQEDHYYEIRRLKTYIAGRHDNSTYLYSAHLRQASVLHCAARRLDCGND